ncbi:calcium-binding protein [Shinella pollutisoli]|uniref:M10 family metallopeptidase C-terminal domain-containing protein n=1 Tax=Shinella pollutisoli TaxID=2250594 RepID=A0ABV7DE10_9HYPH|nr:calcium-binding protein [Shinella pollutisoli]
MSTLVWVELSYNKTEAQSRQSDSFEKLYLAGKVVAYRWGTIFDPNETSVPYYSGWSYDPNNGYDYYEVSIAAVHLSKKDVSESVPGFESYNWSPRKYVSIVVDDISQIPVDLLQRSTADIVTEQLSASFETLVSAYASANGFSLAANVITTYGLHKALQKGVSSLVDVVEKGMNGQISPDQMGLMGEAVVKNMILDMAKVQGVPPILLDAMRHTSYVINRDAPSVENAVEVVMDDTIHGRNAYDAIVLGLGANDVILAGTGDHTISGDVGDDVLIGNSGRDRLVGGYDNDYLYGGAGNDTLVLDLKQTATLDTDYMDGGAGAADTLFITGSWYTGIVLNLATRTVTIKNDSHALVNFRNIEVFKVAASNVTVLGSSGADRIYAQGKGNVVHAGAGNDLLYGGANADKLYGDAGNDVFLGGAGADRFHGGAGSDTASYATAKAGVIVSLAKSRLNTGDAKGDAYSLIENLVGSSFSDRLYGNAAANVLDGGKGNDRLYGGAGSDKLHGGSGKDLLKGDAGNDRLYGGAGADKLYGGSGKDVFLFKSVKDSTASGRDTVYDFSRKQGDRIDLKAIDADATSGGNQAFKFIGTETFHKKAGELRYEKKSGDTFVHGDVNGDGKADFVIRFDASIAFAKGDFIL